MLRSTEFVASGQTFLTVIRRRVMGTSSSFAIDGFIRRRGSGSGDSQCS